SSVIDAYSTRWSMSASGDQLGRRHPPRRKLHNERSRPNRSWPHPRPQPELLWDIPSRAYVYEYKVLLSPHDSAYGTKRISVSPFFRIISAQSQRCAAAFLLNYRLFHVASAQIVLDNF